MRQEISRHNLGDLTDIIFYDDKSAEIVLYGTNPLHRTLLSSSQLDILEKVLKWR